MSTPSLAHLRLATVCAPLALLTACGSGSFAPGAPTDAGAPESSTLVDGAADGPATPSDGSPGGRTLALASGGTQLLVTGSNEGFQITPANLATDVDVIEIHQEYYGIPWSTFATGAAPPAAWKAVMDGLVTSAAGKPIFLSVTMLDGGRNSLSSRTVVTNGAVTAEDNWAAACYDFATASDGAMMKQAYLNYVTWMVGEFSPRWLNVAVEVNLFFEHCPAAAAGVIDVSNAAYMEVKAKNAALVVFPSFQIEHLYGYSTDSCPDQGARSSCFDAAYTQIAPMKRDRFAMSSYPMISAIPTPSALPADWFTRGSSRGNERPLIAETGWNSTPLIVPVGGSCNTVFTSDLPSAAAYLALVLAAGKSASMDLVNWWSNRDFLDSRLMTNCPCSFDMTWCTLLSEFGTLLVDGGGATAQEQGELYLEAFGAMGIRNYDGTPKPALMTEWQAARASPWQP